MFGSVCSQDVRCASAYGVGQSDQPRPTWANVTPAAMSVAAKKETIRCARICILDLSDTKGVQHPVPRADVHAPVGDGDAAEVIPRGDRVAAVPELFAGLTLERVEHRLTGVWNASRRAAGESAAVDRAAGFVPRDIC